MRWTVLLLLLCCLPLSAGDTDVLTRAVKDFASDDPAVRRGASRAVRAFLDQNLGPLLKAMESPDPEVARRAREAVAGLLPGERAGQADTPNQNGAQVVNFGGARGQFRVFVRQNGAFVIGNRDQKADKELKKFGLHGYPCTQELLRRQLGLAAGRGFVVSKVVAGSAAARIGLTEHDVILAVDGKPVMNARPLLQLIGAKEDWLLRRVRVMRGGKVVEVGGPGQVR